MGNILGEMSVDIKKSQVLLIKDHELDLILKCLLSNIYKTEN
jgi:hypothetical protein